MRYLWIALGSLLVVGAAGAGVIYLGGRGPAPEAPPHPLVTEEAHYYVLLDLVEVEPGEWDNNSPPDLFYRVRWKGQDVYESATKDDTLLAKWSNAELRLNDVVTSVSIDDSIKAARITARSGDAVEFLVYDADVGRDDLVGSWTVPVERLRVGDEGWSRPAGRVVSARCRVLPIEGVDFAELTR